MGFAKDVITLWISAVSDTRLLIVSSGGVIGAVLAPVGSAWRELSSQWVSRP